MSLIVDAVSLCEVSPPREVFCLFLSWAIQVLHVPSTLALCEMHRLVAAFLQSVACVPIFLMVYSCEQKFLTLMKSGW